MFTSVAVPVVDTVSPFELAVPCEVFGLDRSDQGLPVWDFAVCGLRPGRAVATSMGFSVVPEHGLDRLLAADLVVVPAWNRARPVPRALREALVAAHERGARLMSVCTGAFVLAECGLLDGRRAATHWRYAAELAARFPKVQVDPNVLYVDEGPILTSAGTAAGIDLCLHVVRQDYGSEVANAIARRMVVPPHRDGGQAQYVDAPVPDVAHGSAVAGVLTWAVEHLDEPLTVEQLAGRAYMSPRTFARRFRQATGTTPLQWVLGQRVLLAQRMLEQGRPVEEVARISGFGTAANLREQFVRHRGVSPQAYRRTFRASG